MILAAGFVGLNNIKANDYLNVIAHALAHVRPLRDYLMLEDLRSRPELAQRFSTLVRKIWNARAFKSHVSPHELLQEISLRSSKRFTLLAQSDPVDFLLWFLNNLHLSLGGSRTKPGSSIVQKVFQGKLKIESQAITAKADASDRLRFEEAAEIKTEVSHYLMLTLDLPPKPIFKDDQDKNIIPQVPLTTVLAKYDGLHPQELLGHRRRYRLLHPLPPFLCFHVKRFAKNKFVAERNPTIVTFSPRALDMSPYVEPNEQHPGTEPILYDLVANVTHETVVETGRKEGELRSVFKVQLLEKGRGKWLQIQDLFVEEVARELLFTSESYIQIWERRRVPGKGKGNGKGKA
jgi:U4/U6.U5 tri-snRNP-associated protein 2